MDGLLTAHGAKYSAHSLASKLLTVDGLLSTHRTNMSVQF